MLWDYQNVSLSDFYDDPQATKVYLLTTSFKCKSSGAFTDMDCMFYYQLTS